jgi:hypothetical protein
MGSNRTLPETRGGALKIIAAIEDPPVIVRILTHLGLPTRAPPRPPARGDSIYSWSAFKHAEKANRFVIFGKENRQGGNA